VTAELFKKEIAEAVRSYDRHVVCLEKTPDQLEQALASLMQKAIHAFESREPGLRHGIALDRQVTIILSQSDGPRPLCAIYFNLSSPYHKRQPAPVPAKSAA
jgi:nitrogen-specific signal transduction histidine kinase